jgi:hypothetical protein
LYFLSVGAAGAFGKPERLQVGYEVLRRNCGRVTLHKTTIMRYIVALLALVATTSSCSRAVVLANPRSSEAPALKVTNRAPQAVTVYVTPAGGQELSVGVVQSNATEVLVVSGVAMGAMARLRAALADGSLVYTKDNVELTRMYEWTVP